MKLTIEENSFFINNPRDFNPQIVNKAVLQDVFEFSYNMIFGDGHHRNKRSGGQTQRKNGEIFANTFQGKLAEVITRNNFIKNGFSNISEPDFNIYGKGIWDDVDLTLNDLSISIKSTAFFSQLLLLETKDWNENATYIPSNKTYDYHILVRIEPDIKTLFKKEKLLFSDKISEEKLQKVIFNKEWKYDIAGVCSKETIKHIIKNEYVLPQNALLKSKTKMDAENYYIQAGSLKTFEDFLELLTKLS